MRVCTYIYACVCIYTFIYMHLSRLPFGRAVRGGVHVARRLGLRHQPV